MTGAADPGWYHAAGDPRGTMRAWNGEAWVTGPEKVSHQPVAERAKGVVIALALLAVVELIDIVLRWRDLAGLYAFRIGFGDALDRRYERLDRIAMTSTALTVVTLVTALLFLVWFHRCYTHLRFIRGSSELLPWQAVASWFVPIVNLWYPFRCMRELTPFVGSDDRGTRPVPNEMLVRWWALYVVSALTELALWFWTPYGLDLNIVWSTVALLLAAVNGVAAVFAIMIVKRISAYQDSRLPEPAPVGPVGPDTGERG